MKGSQKNTVWSGLQADACGQREQRLLVPVSAATAASEASSGTNWSFDILKQAQHGYDLLNCPQQTFSPSLLSVGHLNLHPITTA